MLSGSWTDWIEMKRWVAWSVLSTVMVSGKLGCVFLKLIQLLGKYDSAYQDIDACDHSLEVQKGKLKGMFFRFVPR